MEIKRSGSQRSSQGPAEWFTGSVRIDPLFQPVAPARAGGASVTFDPGACTAWHTHPLGQTLIVTAGVRLAQNAPMTDTAIQEAVDRTPVQWMEHVSDEQHHASCGMVVLMVPTVTRGGAVR